jgi:hypothetical protein
MTEAALCADLVDLDKPLEWIVVERDRICGQDLGFRDAVLGLLAFLRVKGVGPYYKKTKTPLKKVGKVVRPKRNVDLACCSPRSSSRSAFFRLLDLFAGREIFLL